MSQIRFAFVAFAEEFEKAIRDFDKPIAQAATDAMREAGEIAKIESRASIAQAGFSRRWQNALRVEVYPKGKSTSINPAAFIYHKIPYAGVFEDGAVIRGKPRLWLPLPSAPKRIGRNRVTPERVAKIAPDGLQFVKRGGKNPLLAVKVRLSKAKAAAPEKNLTAAAIRKGNQGGGKNGRVVSVPLFVGIDMVKIRKRFSIGKVVQGVRDRLASLYLNNFRGD